MAETEENGISRFSGEEVPSRATRPSISTPRLPTWRKKIAGRASRMPKTRTPTPSWACWLGKGRRKLAQDPVERAQILIETHVAVTKQSRWNRPCRQLVSGIVRSSDQPGC